MRIRNNRIFFYNKQYRLVYFFILFISLINLGMIFSVPVLSDKGSIYSFSAALIKFFYAPLCHQIQERCFVIGGHFLPVCSRCTGIYAGFFLGTVVFPFISNKIKDVYPPKNILLLAFIPMGLDVGLKWILHIDTGLLFHFITGSIFSILFSFYAIPGLLELSDLLIKRGEMNYGKPTQ